ncbi:uncharacterized protein [Aquarana catesbeiana]|uniref:uncharacterized protein isoform X2 n=1 Tax=Aquarana catesbeiana TaxID=8400 RepID=UPI003CC9A367
MKNEMDRFHFTGFHQHPVIKHHKYLEKKITDVDPILHSLLQQDLITKDQHDYILNKSSDHQKMKELYQHVRLWKTKEQDKFYKVLRQQHFIIIRDMEMAKRRLTCGFRPLSPATETFLKNKRQQLIEMVILVDPVLDDLLDQDVLQKKQYDDIKSYHSPKEKMRELMDIARDWGDYAKYLLYQALRKHNSSVVTDLERFNKKNAKPGSKPAAGEKTQTPVKPFQQKKLGRHKSSLQPGSRLKAPRPKTMELGRGHFIDRHYWDLIKVILMVDPVLDDLLDEKLLTQDQFNKIMKMTTSQRKMVKLSETINKWKHTQKDKVYLALRQHNYHSIRPLEILEEKRATSLSTREHFVVHHWSQLKRRLSTLDPVLDDLKAQNLITREQCVNLHTQETFEEKMTEFHNVVTSWPEADKDKLYLSLRKHNYFIIKELENNDKKVNKHSSEYFETPKATSSSQAEGKDKEWVYMKLAVTCSVCMDIFADPVTLACGHSFCLGCITKTWKEQFDGESSCPQCRQRFKKKPDLKRSLTLSQIVECYQSSQPDCGATSHGCTYCTHNTVPAVGACLTCESFLCNDHLNVHCGALVLLEPMVSLENRKCSIHHKILDYYCNEDSKCLCASCCIIGEHRGHHVEPLMEAVVKKKEKLRKFQEKLVLHLRVLNANVQDLKDCRRELEEFCETQLYLHLTGNRNGAFQHGPPNGGSTLLKLDLQCISSQVQQLEIMYNEMSIKKQHIENVCHMTDALMVMQESKSESADFYHSMFSNDMIDPFQHFRILKNTKL